MSKLRELYRRSGWHTVFSYDDEASTARTHLLCATIVQSVANGFTTGIFYTGLLIGYGINIVNISIITLIPYLASLFSLLTPCVLERFPVRRRILTTARIAYYTVNILGITLLPALVKDPDARVFGLIAIVFVAYSINFLFGGYTPWHIVYITPEVRTGYLSAVSLVSNLSSSFFLIVASIVTDHLPAEAQLKLIVALRFAAYGIAFLDVYFLQKPNEPVYTSSTAKPSLLDIFRLPLSNKRFLLTCMISGLYTYVVHMAAGVQQAWLLQSVGTSYLYINCINGTYALIILITSPIWSRFMQRKGTFLALTAGCLLFAPTYFAYAFVTAENYTWLMTIIMLIQHCVSVLLTFSAGNLIYINLPKTDQTNYISFNTVLTNVSVLASVGTGTWVVAAMGGSVWHLLGHPMGGVPTLMLVQFILIVLLGLFVLLLRKKVEQEGVKI